MECGGAEHRGLKCSVQNADCKVQSVRVWRGGV